MTDQGDLFGGGGGSGSNDEARTRLAREIAAYRASEAADRAKVTRGMVRTNDHATSVAAASNVKRKQNTIRTKVEQFAIDMREHGFTDDELRKSHGDSRPESSYRKRRTELAQEGIILDTGKTRQNRHRERSIVWVHRDFAGPNAKQVPPPMQKRDTKATKLETAVIAAKSLIEKGEALKAYERLCNALAEVAK